MNNESFNFDIKSIPLAYDKGPNINAIYGPWDTTQDALAAAQSIYSELSDSGDEIFNIPVGTTVGVYTSSDKSSVEEYWYIDGEFRLKFTPITNELRIFDTNGHIVTQVQVQEFGASPNTIKAKRFHNGQEVFDGSITYRIDNGNEQESIDNSININSVQQHVTINWKFGTELVATKTIFALQAIVTQKFYAYTESETPPECDNNFGNSYQNNDWSPNTQEYNEWSSERLGLNSDDRKVEWLIERQKINNSWREYSGPTIIGMRGEDGLFVEGKQFIYACSSENSQTVLNNLSNDVDQLRSFGVYIPWENDNTYQIDGSTFTWYKYNPGLDIDTKVLYIYASESQLENNEWSAWTNPVLMYAYTAGKDADEIEYLFIYTQQPLSSNSQTFGDLKTCISYINGSDYVTSETKLGSVFDAEVDIPVGNKQYTWYSTRQGLSNERKIEYCIYRKITDQGFGIKNYGEIQMEEPIIFASYGADGIDGKGIEYIYILSNSNTEAPSIYQPQSGQEWAKRKDDIKEFWDDDYVPFVGSEGDDKWSDNLLQVTHELPYLWCSSRSGRKGSWGRFSQPVIWDTYQDKYEIFLSNDNVSVPISELGVINARTAELCTKTEVILKLGQKEINYLDSNNNITIICNHYIHPENSKTWYFDTSEFVADSEIYLATFEAYLNYQDENNKGILLATKIQNVRFQLSEETYKLFISPNSRQWYGDNSYSTESYSASIYKINNLGQFSEVEDISGFSITIQSINSSNTHDYPPENNVFELSGINYGSSSDLLALLKYNDTVVDSETIDTIDLSGIVNPEQSRAIRLVLSNDSLEIPDQQRRNPSVLQANSLVKVSAYDGRDAIDIAGVTVTSLAYANNPETNLKTVVTKIDNKTYSIYVQFADQLQESDQIVEDDIFIELEVTINEVDNDITKSVRYYKSYKINLLSPEQPSYDFQVSPNVISASSNTIEFDVDNLNFIVKDSASGEDLDPSLYRIYYTLYKDGSTVARGSIRKVNSTFQWYNTNDELIQNGLNSFVNILSRYSTCYFTFSLKVGDKYTKYQTVQILYKYDIGSNVYDVNLSNPYVQIEKGTANVSSLIQTDYNVYYGQNNYSNYSIKGYIYNNTQYLVSNNDSSAAFTNLCTAIQSNISSVGIQQITHMIDITETGSDGDPVTVTVYKTQILQIVDFATYSIMCNPTTIIKNQSNQQEVTISVTKTANGETSTISNLQQENLKVFVNNSNATITNSKINISYNTNDTYVTVILKKEISTNVFIDVDWVTLGLIKDGKDGKDGNNGVTIRPFKGSLSQGTVFRNDFGLTGNKQTCQYNSQSGQYEWINDTDPALYRDYFLDNSGSQTKIYVCRQTYVHIADDNKVNGFNPSDNVGYPIFGNDVSQDSVTKLKFSEAWEEVQNLGAGFFEHLYALSGNIEILSSSQLTVNGQILMTKSVTENNQTSQSIVAGINGDDTSNVDPSVVFWSGGTGANNGNGIDAKFYVDKDGVMHAKEGVFNGSYEPIAKELESKNNIALKIDPRFISAVQDDDDNYCMDIPVNFKNFGYTTIIKISDAEPARKINWFRYGGTVDNPNKEYIISNACFVDLPHVALVETSAGLTDSNLLTGFFNQFQGDPSNLYPTIHRWYKNIYDINIDNIDFWPYNISIITHFHDLMLKRYDDAKKYIGREILVSGTGTLYGVLDVVQTVDSPSNMRKWYTTPNYEYNPVDILSHFILTDINLGSYDLSLSLQPSITYTLQCVCKNITWESHTIPLIFWVAYKMHKTPYANSASADEEMLSLDIQQVSDNNQEIS